MADEPGNGTRARGSAAADEGDQKKQPAGKRDKADRIAAAAAEVIEAERIARQQKTARLRALRIARDVVDKARPKRGKPGAR